MTHSTVALSVADLLASPALQLSLRAGGTGLARPVRWAHVSELADPAPWLFGGELIMTTGLGVPRNAAGQVGYIERLDGSGVSALAVTEGLHSPSLRKAMLRTADRHGFPILTVPLSVPFIAIAQEVAMAVQSEMHRRLTAQLHVFGALRVLATEDLSPSQLFSRLERLSGYRLYLATAHGTPLLPGVPAPPAHLAGLLPPTFGAPPAVPDGYVLPVPAPGGPAGFVLAIESPGVIAAGLGVVQHIATIAALQVSTQRHEREIQSREGADTLLELIQGVIEPATAARRLTRMGYEAGADLVLAVARRVGGAGGLDPQDLVKELDAVAPPILAMRQQAEVYLLLRADAPLVEVFGQRSDVAIGVSRAVPLGRSLAASKREALWALGRALDGHAPVGRRISDDGTGGEGGCVVEFGKAAAGRWLPEDPTVTTALVDTVLGAVIGYDQAHGGLLLPSVRTWLEHDRRTAEAAAALHVHPNTLAYRVRRFEELSGRSLHATTDLAEVWLALHAALSTP